MACSDRLKKPLYSSNVRSVSMHYIAMQGIIFTYDSVYMTLTAG